LAAPQAGHWTVGVRAAGPTATADSRQLARSRCPRLWWLDGAVALRVRDRDSSINRSLVAGSHGRLGFPGAARSGRGGGIDPVTRAPHWAAERALVNHNPTGDVPDGGPAGGERTTQAKPSWISSQGWTMFSRRRRHARELPSNGRPMAG